MAALPKRYTSILYVDTDLDDRQLVEEALKDIDSRIVVMTVDGYADLDREIEKLNHVPDLVIVAINQPLQSEVERFTICQSHSKLKNLPFCILSSTKTASIIDQVYSLGATSFMIKPSDYNSLKSLLKSVVTYNWANDLQLARERFIVTEQVAAGSFSILMIDDDPEDRAILFNALFELYPTMPCESAFDGEDAIKYLTDKQFVPDVIFLDLNMPRMNGIECLKVMREMKKLDRCKIIVFSVSNDPQDMEITNALGANHFVTKPPTHESLINVLSEVIAA